VKQSFLDTYSINYCFQIQTTSEEKTNVQVDYDKLADFLKKVTPGILEALDETYGTNAFDDYNPNVTESSSASVELLKRINASKESSTQVHIPIKYYTILYYKIIIKHIVNRFSD